MGQLAEKAYKAAEGLSITGYACNELKWASGIATPEAERLVTLFTALFKPTIKEAIEAGYTMLNGLDEMGPWLTSGHGRAADFEVRYMALLFFAAYLEGEDL